MSDFSKMARNSFSGSDLNLKTCTIDSFPSRDVLRDAQKEVLGTVERFNSTRNMKKRIERWMMRVNSDSTAPSRTILHVAIKLADSGEDFSAKERITILRVINKEYWEERNDLTDFEHAVLMSMIEKVEKEKPI